MSGAAAHAPLQVAFHHLHLNDEEAAGLVAYYAKLFDPATTTPAAIGPVRGIEAEGVFLLINPVREEPSESSGPVWHFGWGAVSLDEAYDRHRMHEIELTLPMRSFAAGLHVHLESENPIRAAEWYRDRLSASITTERSNAHVRPPNPLHRRPAAIVTLPGITFAIYQSVGTLASSRGRRVDHVGFTADLDEARDAGFTALEPAGRLGPFQTAMIEGPDRLAIELVAVK